jgi:3-hydroxyisobutyrate dehydrogenase-like beta-hydroxyacid dehydrogenase
VAAQPASTEVSIVGLGAMGAAIASVLLARGRTVSVWNRTAGKADALVARGALRRDRVADAVGASPLTVFVLLRGGDVEAVLEDSDVAGRTLVNLSSLDPAEARMLGERMTARGARYLTGAIMANPRDIGTSEAAVIYSGPEEAFLEHRVILEAIAGRSTYVDRTWDGAKRLSLSLGAQLYSAIGGFLEGVNLARDSGLSASTYGRAVTSILGPFYGRFIADLCQRIDCSDHTALQSSIRTEAQVVSLVTNLLSAGGLPSFSIDGVGAYLRAAEQAGLSSSGLAAMPDFIREQMRDSSKLKRK